MAGRIGISEELVTKDMPFVNVHTDDIKNAETCRNTGEINLQEIDDYLDEDMRLNMAKDD